MKKSLHLRAGINLGTGLASALHQDRQAYRRVMAWMTRDSQPRRIGNARRTVRQQDREFLP